MAKKRSKTNGKHDAAKDLWVSPRFTLKGENGERAWDHRQVGSPGSGRFLELADIALGTKKAEPRKKRVAVGGTHDIADKTEPYSS